MSNTTDSVRFVTPARPCGRCGDVDRSTVTDESVDVSSCVTCGLIRGLPAGPRTLRRSPSGPRHDMPAPKVAGAGVDTFRGLDKKGLR